MTRPSQRAQRWRRRPGGGKAVRARLLPVGGDDLGGGGQGGGEGGEERGAGGTPQQLAPRALRGAAAGGCGSAAAGRRGGRGGAGGESRGAVRRLCQPQRDKSPGGSAGAGAQVAGRGQRPGGRGQEAGHVPAAQRRRARPVTRRAPARLRPPRARRRVRPRDRARRAARAAPCSRCARLPQRGDRWGATHAGAAPRPPTGRVALMRRGGGSATALTGSAVGAGVQRQRRLAGRWSSVHVLSRRRASRVQTLLALARFGQWPPRRRARRPATAPPAS